MIERHEVACRRVGVVAGELSLPDRLARGAVDGEKCIARIGCGMRIVLAGAEIEQVMCRVEAG